MDAYGDAIELTVHDGVISGGATNSGELDASGLTAVAGFVDIQMNAGWGADFTHDPDSIWRVGAVLPTTGVTSFCPTIITSSHDRVIAARNALSTRPNGYIGAEPIGLHIEGPHLSPERRGTHPEELLVSPLDSTIEPQGVAIVTVAPELEGALELIARLASAAVTVSIGHSAATAAETIAAIDAGATLGTHLFNAMPPITGREPGIAGILLTDTRARFGVIVDGVHLDAATVRLAWNAAPDRFILITDAISAVGMPEGDYEIGGVAVTLAGGAVRNAAGNLAGSVLTMDVGLANLMRTTGASLASAVAAVTSTPAAALNRGDIGTIAVGARGDITLLDGGSVAGTIVGGRVCYLQDEDRLQGGHIATS